MTKTNKSKVVIQVSERDDARAWALLQRHSPGVALPDRTFVVSAPAVRALRSQGVDFTLLSNDTEKQAGQGVAAGERI